MFNNNKQPALVASSPLKNLTNKRSKLSNHPFKRGMLNWDLLIVSASFLGFCSWGPTVARAKDRRSLALGPGASGEFDKLSLVSPHAQPAFPLSASASWLRQWRTFWNPRKKQRCGTSRGGYSLISMGWAPIHRFKIPSCKISMESDQVGMKSLLNRKKSSTRRIHFKHRKQNIVYTMAFFYTSNFKSSRFKIITFVHVPHSHLKTHATMPSTPES